MARTVNDLQRGMEVVQKVYEFLQAKQAKELATSLEILKNGAADVSESDTGYRAGFDSGVNVACGAMNLRLNDFELDEVLDLFASIDVPTIPKEGE